MDAFGSGPYIHSISAPEISQILFDPKKNKYHYDLLKVAKAQIEELGIPFKLEILNENTVTNTSFSSYRREKSPCRNWSFILKSK
jgi:copper oxidase (laccase) domain-containing protein